MKTMEDIVCVIDLPYRLHSLGNSTTSYWERRKRTKAEHRMITLALTNKAYREATAVTVSLIRIAPRTLDSDNLQASFKHIRDKIAQLYFPEDKIGRSDSYDFFRWKYGQEKGKPKEYAIKVILHHHEVP